MVPSENSSACTTTELAATGAGAIAVTVELQSAVQATLGCRSLADSLLLQLVQSVTKGPAGESAGDEGPTAEQWPHGSDHCITSLSTSWTVRTWTADRRTQRLSHGFRQIPSRFKQKRGKVPAAEAGRRVLARLYAGSLLQSATMMLSSEKADGALQLTAWVLSLNSMYPSVWMKAPVCSVPPKGNPVSASQDQPVGMHVSAAILSCSSGHFVTSNSKIRTGAMQNGALPISAKTRSEADSHAASQSSSSAMLSVETWYCRCCSGVNVTTFSARSKPPGGNSWKAEAVSGSSCRTKAPDSAGAVGRS